jgi:hypothetical protein
MGQGSDLPNINPEINREERKRGGLAALLLRLGIGSEAGGGAGGGFGGLLGAGAGGGLLATKAGIIGLVLVGSTVAGSLGVVAYKVFGPTSSDRDDASFSQLFAPKPKDAAGASGQGSSNSASGSANGASQSLQYLVDANSKGGASSQDQSAQSAAAAPASAAASAAPPLKNDNISGSTAAKLKTDHKIGELSKGAASGSGGTASAPGGSNNASLLANAKGGSLAGMGGSRGAALSSISAARSRALGGGAVGQAAAAHGNQIGAASSFAAGRTYDGSSAGPSQEGPGMSSGRGAPGSAADAAPPVNPGGGQQNSFGDVPTATGANVTPWQAAINTAMLAVMGAAALLYFAMKIAKMKMASAAMTKTIICILAGIAAGLGAFVISLGARIGGGAYGQQAQGGLLALAGGCLMATAAAAIYGAVTAKPDGPPVKSGDPINPKDPSAGSYDDSSALKKNATADQDALANAMGKNTQLLMICCGGAALAATVGAYLLPKNSYSPGLFQNGRPPDWDNGYHPAQSSNMPSEKILDRYLV